MLRDESVYEILENERIHSIIVELEKFLKCISKNNGLCAYGKDEILKAAEYGAIEKLIIIDEIVKDYENIIDLVKKMRGEVLFVPSESEIGEQVKAFGGIIALLRYKVQ